MTTLSDLNNYIRATTVEYRKGAEVIEHEPENGVQVTEIFNMPPTPDRGVLVDCWFINVGFTERATDKDEFIRLLRAALGPGEFETITAETIIGGPSYITLGAWLGSQDQALRMLALGKFYDLWNIITPTSLFGPAQDAGQATKFDLMVGGGFILIGMHPQTSALLTG